MSWMSVLAKKRKRHKKTENSNLKNNRYQNVNYRSFLQFACQGGSPPCPTDSYATGCTI